jgi:hypothetical protein
MVEPASLLLGLEGLGVSAVVRSPDRTRVVEVITVDPDASRCPDCAVASAIGLDLQRGCLLCPPADERPRLRTLRALLQ